MNGTPARSSWTPGAIPMKRYLEGVGPAQGTGALAWLWRGQAVQERMSERSWTASASMPQLFEKIRELVVGDAPVLDEGVYNLLLRQVPDWLFV